MLTQDQLLVLRTDLKQLANIEYDDVLNEQLDHYASLTETRMAGGLSFDDASRWAWADMGSGKGIQDIQDKYVKNIQRQVDSQHLSIIKGYFRWPTITVTSMVTALVYVAIPMLPDYVIDSTFWVMFVIPVAFMSLWKYRYMQAIPVCSSKLIVKKRLHQMLGYSSRYILYFILVSGGLFHPVKRTEYYQAHTTATVILGSLMLLYNVSLIQLYSRQFTY